MAEDDNDLGTKLDDLAKRTLDRVLEDPKEGEPAMSLDVMLDTLKTVSAYYIGTRKIRVKQPDEDEGPSNFGDFRANIRKVK